MPQRTQSGGVASLNALEHDYVAPHMFGKPDVQRWLQQSSVGDGFIALAKASVMNQTADEDSAIREQLAGSYADQTGESVRLAEGPIDVVVACLTAGFLASMPKEQRELAGMLQTVGSGVADIQERLDESLAAVPFVRELVRKAADDALRAILDLKALDYPEATARAEALLNRIEGGDLTLASREVQNAVRYWTARLLAGPGTIANADNVARARDIRQNLAAHDVPGNLLILDALIRAAEGDGDHAIRLLRDETDPEARSELLGLLIRFKGAEAALNWCSNVHPSKDPEYFLDFGWRDWAVCLARAEQWDHAARGLRTLATQPDWAPVVALAEGTINVALLLPVEIRNVALKEVPRYLGVAPNVDVGAKERHGRAVECFEHAEKCLPAIASDRARLKLAAWRTWLQLMSPNINDATAARESVRERLEAGETVPDLVSLVWCFGIDFDHQVVLAKLKEREQLGGLTNEDIFVECMVQQKIMKSREFAAYLEARMARLDLVMEPGFTTAMLFGALLEDGQVERAGRLVTERGTYLDQDSVTRMEVALEKDSGADTKTRLEALFRESDELRDLRNLVEYLKELDDRVALLPLAKDLFGRDPTLNNAAEVLRCLSLPPADYAGIVSFLEAHPTLLEQHDRMKSALAQGLFHVGRAKEAQKINDALSSQREHHDLTLDVHLAISTGDWEQLAVIVNREWPHRKEIPPENLIMLARLASQGGQPPERSMELARLAVQTAPNDPHVLLAAHMVYIQLGRDEEADPQWLSDALAHSAEDGPLWEMDTKQMVLEWLPRQRERNADIDRQFLNGNLPLTLAAGALNESLARVLLNEPPIGLPDGRRRPVLPIISGRHRQIDIEDTWKVGLDVTSAMVLARTGLLEKALGEFRHVKVAPDLMGCLYAEMTSVRFHQPLLVESARRVKRLISAGRIKLVERPQRPRGELADEVGTDLAVLLEASREQNGVTVCSAPIYKVNSLMDRQADTSDYDDLIISPADLCALARRVGLVDKGQHERAMAFSESQGQASRANLPRSMTSGPIYVDRLALSHLQSSRILEPLANSGLDLWIHPNVSDETDAFVEIGDRGNDLAKQVEVIRQLLRKGIESGSVSLLPHAPERAKEGLGRLPSVGSMEGLMHGCGDCDVLCVDDRYVNRQPMAEDPAGKLVPVACVLDVLRYLRTRQAIDDEEYWSAKHRLREAGFAFIPLESDELLKHLTDAECNERQLLETAEMRTIRQTINRLDSLELADITEAQSLSQGLAMASVNAMRQLWADTSIDANRAAALASWVWRYLPLATSFVSPRLGEAESNSAFTEIVMHRTSMMMLPPALGSATRRAAYGQWLDSSVIAPSRPATPELAERAALSARETIASIDDQRQVIGALFLENLPDGLSDRVVADDPDFALDCGLRQGKALDIGGKVQLEESVVLEAAKALWAGADATMLPTLSGSKASVSLAEGADKLRIGWIDEEGKHEHIDAQQFALLSEDATVRETALRDILRCLGPTAKSTHALLGEVGSRVMTAEEVSAVLTEETTGVARTQSRLAQGIAVGEMSLDELVPSSRSYWEQFSGPVPNSEDPETYITEQLIPYRRSLIEADLAGGLNICCIGALRDDLSPGAWLDGVGDEALLNALASIPAEGNPIAMLGILDVVLYRANDTRFREIAERVTKALLDEHLGQPGAYDGYRFLEVLLTLTTNRMATVEGAGACPGFWRRMCAWMQAGQIVRTSVIHHALPDVDELESWFAQCVTWSGVARGLADLRVEPLLQGHTPRSERLRLEVLRRVTILKQRHQSAGRTVPLAEAIDATLFEAQGEARLHFEFGRGPFELHILPDTPVPDAIAQVTEGTWNAEGIGAVLWLVGLSQLFVINADSCSRVQEVVESNSQKDDIEYKDAEPLLLAASIIAAAAGNPELADAIGVALTSLAPSAADAEHIQRMVHTLMQAAAAHRKEADWSRWLDDRLSEVASRLPAAPNQCLQTFHSMLEGLEMALPMHMWCHIRAKRIVAAGLERAT